VATAEFHKEHPAYTLTNIRFVNQLNINPTTEMYNFNADAVPNPFSLGPINVEFFIPITKINVGTSIYCRFHWRHTTDCFMDWWY